MAKKFKGAFEEGFLSFIEANGQESFGYVNVTSRSKKTAKVYVRYGTIIAIENSNYKTNIFERVTSLDGINKRSVELLSQRFKDDEGNIAIVEAALDQQMASGSELSKIIKEHFIDSFYDMFGWGQVVLEWVSNKEPQVPTVPAIQPSDLINKAELINSKIVNEIAPMLQVEPEEILSLTPQIGDNNDYSSLRPNEMTILQYSTGEYTIEDIIYGTGISLSGSQFAVARLWLSRHLFLVTPTGELIAFDDGREEEQFANEETHEAYTEEYHHEAEESSSPQTEESYEREEDFADAPESEEELQEAAEPEYDTDNALNSFFDEEEAAPPVEEEEPEEVKTATKLERRPRKLTFQEALAMTDEKIENPIEEEIIEEIVVEDSEEDMEDFEVEEISLEEEQTPEVPAVSSANSRLTEIVEQLKSLMSEAQESLQESDKALHSKKEELEELYGKKRELNSEIMRSEEEYALLIDNKQTLYNEYKQIIQQIKGMEGTL